MDINFKWDINWDLFFRYDIIWNEMFKLWNM